LSEGMDWVYSPCYDEEEEEDICEFADMPCGYGYNCMECDFFWMLCEEGVKSVKHS